MKNTRKRTTLKINEKDKKEIKKLFVTLQNFFDLSIKNKKLIFDKDLKKKGEEK